MIHFARLHLAFALLPVAAGSAAAQAIPPSPTRAGTATLSSVDYNFVAQANLGAPFQIDSGRIAERKGSTAAIRDYAHLMVVTHVPVVDALNKVLQRKALTAPPDTLLRGAYDAMISSLKAEHGRAFDRDYADGQVQYQKGNAALFRYEIERGTDPDLKEFARQTLPKIEDHLKRALKPANATDVVAAPN
jgi:putative membrane protein